jgi:hypothetical protein
MISLRGLRLRWFSGGCFVGVLAGLLITLGISVLAVQQLPIVSEYFGEQADVSVIIGEGYINREATRRIGNGYPSGIDGVTVTSAQINLSPGNLMDLSAKFHVSGGFFNFDVNTTVQNELSVQDGNLVISMVGDPQIGDLDVPIHLLPFDLDGTIRGAVDRVNNDLLISEINDTVKSSFGSGSFTVDSVSTDDSGMTIRLISR